MSTKKLAAISKLTILTNFLFKKVVTFKFEWVLKTYKLLAVPLWAHVFGGGVGFGCFHMSHGLGGWGSWAFVFCFFSWEFVFVSDYTLSS